MKQTARGWRVLAGGSLAAIAVGMAGVVGLSGNVASAEPLFPPPPIPAPATATQTVPVAPQAAGVTAPAGIPPAAQPLPPPAVPGRSLAPSPVSPAAPSAVAGDLATSSETPPPSATLVPASSGTLRDYLNEQGVHLVPQSSSGFNALDIALPAPAGWTQVPDPNVPDAFVVIANRSGDALYTSNAQVVVYKLIGNFDPKEAITHGYVDSQQLLAWQTTSASLADFGDFPSSIIEGTYRQNDMTLNTSRRHVIATSGPDKYLVSLAVTTAVSQVIADAPAADAIVNGFRVAAAKASPPPAATPPAPHGLPRLAN